MEFMDRNGAVRFGWVDLHGQDVMNRVGAWQNFLGACLSLAASDQTAAIFHVSRNQENLDQQHTPGPLPTGSCHALVETDVSEVKVSPRHHDFNGSVCGCLRCS